ncbi:MAG: glycosyltransferase family 4 protein, partial [Gemmatimonadetes bacterium]|nr:glycosyltransferase family 4 protein [Gemmatimonadota bacterium]
DLRSVLFFAAARLLPGRRLVWSIQGGPAFGRLSTFAARLADDIVVVSRAASKAVPPAVRKRVEHKLVVNYVGIDASHYLPDAPDGLRSEFRARYELPGDAVVITSAGSICHRKGFDILLRALEIVRDGGDRVHLAIAGAPEGAGSAEYSKDLQRQVAEKNLPVTFVGWLDDLRDLLAASDVFALASREEGLGRVTLEAMATRLPAVVTRAGGSEETVVDGESGFVVPPEAPEELAARLRLLARDPAERRRIGANARRRCEEVFSLDAFVGRMLDLLRHPPGSQEAPGAARARPAGEAFP